MRTGGDNSKPPRRAAHRGSDIKLSRPASPTFFIVGTDTGVGKTLLTCLLVEWLRSMGVDALAVKPFISGGLNDARILKRVQRARLSVDEISPYQYRLPLAPAIAAEKQGKSVRLRTVISYIELMQKRCDCLLVEGCGGLLSPLGRGFNTIEIIHRVPVHAIVVARNRLGALNHILLTLRALESSRVLSMRVALMNRAMDGDLVQRSNLEALRKLVSCSVSVLPDLGGNACGIGRIKANATFLQKTLAGLLSFDTVTTLLEAAVVEAVVKKEEKGALTSDGERVNSTTQI